LPSKRDGAPQQARNLGVAMLGFSQRSQTLCSFRRALDMSLAIVEFDPRGHIVAANDKFCGLFGYSREELCGKHHSMFVDAVEAQTREFQDYCDRLRRGEAVTRDSMCLGKGGSELQIVWNCSAVLDRHDRVERVVAVATDSTADKLKHDEMEAKLKAVLDCQAAVEFTPSGEVLTANENFLRMMDYSLNEIKGRNETMFVDPAYVGAQDYIDLWTKINRGESVVGVFHRNGKGGRRVLLQGFFNPIVDRKGRVVKVIEFAIDISDLADLGRNIAKLAAGDVERSIEKPFKPMFEPIRRDFNAAHAKLKTTLLSIADIADVLAANGRQVAVASEDLSRRTEQQAASLEETSAALTEVTNTVRKTADGAGRARAVVGEARADAEHSGEVMRQAVEAMERIEKSSHQIGQIIGAIDEIAFQTNLLALNAGVEAARAREAGRGFAVVASEVRALAQRSAEAAKEIKALVSASTGEVSEGVKLVAQTGDALLRIINKVGAINTLITEMATGAEEESTSLHEVNTAVAQMDEAVQQNAAMAEESTAASRSLMSEAAKLAELVSQVRLGKGASAETSRTELKVTATQRVAPQAESFGPGSYRRLAQSCVDEIAMSRVNR
jgi:methyl-accepting chemotaxis protein